MLPSRINALGFRALAVCLALGLPALAEDAVAKNEPAVPVADDAHRAAATERVLDNILAKEGISMGGVFRSQYLHSSLGGPWAIPSLRSEESVEYTSVDFDLKARPNTATQGHLIFRMHQDWRNFFSDIGNPINSRWISIDWKVHGMFSYNAGDFRQHYSPLTMYSPDIDVMYEPDLFAVHRQEAQDEVFLGENDRLLQGVNLNFDAAVDKGEKGLLKEMHVNLLGTRLRSVETSVQNGDKVTDFIERSPVEKFLGAGNLDLVLPAGISLGGSYLRIFDKKGTYSFPSGNADTAAQKTSIWAARAGLDIASLLEAKTWALGLNGEYASSKDDSNYFKPKEDTLRSHPFTGTATVANLNGGWKSGEMFGFHGQVSYLRNEADYRNELAQSPTFVGERIMNIDNDTAKIRTNDVRARDYSTFDAMYRHVFKFAPSEGTNLWQKAPFQKLSYTNSIMTQSEMASFLALRSDPSLQLIMPFGPATANRTGLRSDLTFNAWGDRIEVKTVFAQLDEVKGNMADTLRALPKTRFTQAGGGLKLEVGSMMGLANPITLSGSLVRSAAKNDGLAGDSVFVSHELTSDFTNVGARWQIWKRFALLGAYQQIKNAMKAGKTDGTQAQENMGGGMEYKVAAGAFVTFSMDKISVKHTGTLPSSTDFSQLQTDLLLSVHF